MNTARIKQAAIEADTYTKALEWLELHGKELTGQDSSEAEMFCRLGFASACPGAKEAQLVLSSAAQQVLPKIVEQATRYCREKIDMAKFAIREETSR